MSHETVGIAASSQPAASTSPQQEIRDETVVSGVIAIAMPLKVVHSRLQRVGPRHDDWKHSFILALVAPLSLLHFTEACDLNVATSGNHVLHTTTNKTTGER